MLQANYTVHNVTEKGRNSRYRFVCHLHKKKERPRPRVANQEASVILMYNKQHRNKIKTLLSMY